MIDLAHEIVERSLLEVDLALQSFGERAEDEVLGPQGGDGLLEADLRQRPRGLGPGAL